MKLIFLKLAAALLTIAVAGHSTAQPNCAALIRPSCLEKFGAGVQVAPTGACKTQIDAYRNCVADSVGDDPTGLGPDGDSDLRELFKAAIHHYDRYSGRFERRVLTGGAQTPDLINIYGKKGVIYYYGKSELSQRALTKRANRSAVADAYVLEMVRIFRDHEAWRERRAAFRDAANALAR